MTDVVQVITRIGESVVEVAFVDDIEGAPRTVTDAAVRARAGIAEVTLTRVARPVRCVPRPTTDRRPFAYLVLSLGVHLCVWILAPAYTAGAPAVELTGSRYLAFHPGPAVEPTGDEGAYHVSMQLAGARAPRRATLDSAPSVPSLTPTEIADRLVGAPGSTFEALAQRGGSSYGTDNSFGANRRGANLEDGGTGWGTVAAGRYGTLGDVGDADPTWAPARGSGTPRQRVAQLPTVYLCGRPGAKHSCIKAAGELDKEIIYRYVRRRLDRVQYCYERALLSDPNLSGTVAVQFLIAASGSVTQATAIGMSAEVADCVAGVIRAMEFPRAENGGATQVNYPFTFRSADEQL
ncbi:MAG: AgmX/PglI C-terminal domain-containing protein [Kofleriaceae bacterium]|nr:AgmX/PglI C-terminal domain-containing protein [Kofleriaceae bacterium]